MVLIAFVLLLLLTWSLVSYLKAQRSLRWWHCRQSIHLCDEADAIRNGLLQESFSLRRNLEISLTNSTAVEKTDWLSQIEHFHHGLKQLSDRLAPMEDNLPLAIQDVLASWQSRYAEIKFTSHLPHNWLHDSQDRSRVVLMALDELLRIHLTSTLPKTAIVVVLKPSAQGNELMVQFCYSDVATSTPHAGSEELPYLRQSFRLLTSGDCFCQRQGEALTWLFRWQSVSNRPTITRT